MTHVELLLLALARGAEVGEGREDDLLLCWEGREEGDRRAAAEDIVRAHLNVHMDVRRCVRAKEGGRRVEIVSPRAAAEKTRVACHVATRAVKGSVLVHLEQHSGFIPRSGVFEGHTNVGRGRHWGELRAPIACKLWRDGDVGHPAPQVHWAVGIGFVGANGAQPIDGLRQKGEGHGAGVHHPRAQWHVDHLERRRRVDA